eukprot:IDg13418t1
MFRAPLTRSTIILRGSYAADAPLLSYRRLISTSTAHPVSHPIHSRGTPHQSHSHSQHLSGIALALSTAASCSALLSARNGTLRADFSTLSSPLSTGTTAEISIDSK